MNNTFGWLRTKMPLGEIIDLTDMGARTDVDETASRSGLLLAWCPCAFALNPSLDINQYAHTAWTVRDGFFKGTV